MKRELKNQQMRQRIMESACAEFSRRGYAGSSINTICAAQNLSKGIVYHYFETKDDLYLACVSACFQQLTEHIRTQMLETDISLEKHLETYFSIRIHFFRAHPAYQRIFCEAVIAPPAHLKAEIQMCKQNFDALNTRILQQLLSPVPLRPDISASDVIEVFRQFQDFINIQYQIADLNDHTFEAREEHCLRALNILLYGVVQRKDGMQYGNE